MGNEEVEKKERPFVSFWFGQFRLSKIWKQIDSVSVWLLDKVNPEQSVK